MNDSGGRDGPGPGHPEDRLHGPPRRRLRRRKMTDEEREHRRRRLRRRSRRAYIRSVYSLPSLATLGNAICGFGAIYVCAIDPSGDTNEPWTWTAFFIHHHFLAAAYLIFAAMLFDAIDGRLARFTRHTTDFGGQLDSLADVVSFGVAPAFMALEIFHAFVQDAHLELPTIVTRAVWAIGALYMSCAAIRLARFNVSNEHGEQHHFSFLGLPSPGAASVIAAFVLMQQDLIEPGDRFGWKLHPALYDVSAVFVWLLPPLVLVAGLLMVSDIRYPHLVNRYLRGRRSIARLLLALTIVLLMVIVHRYTLGVGTLVYTFSGPASLLMARLRRRSRVGESAPIAGNPAAR